MDNRLTTKEFLRVFDYICSHGDKMDNQYKLGEIQASHDYDGYTCWLTFKDVTVTLMFHSSLKIEYGETSNYADFIGQCLSLATSKSYSD